MDFTFDEEQRLFRDSVRDFLAAECRPEQVRALWETDTGRSRQCWKKLGELGVLGLLVPEAYGGLGLSETGLVLLLEETGRAALPEPVTETVAVAVPLLAELEDDGPAREWLPRVVAGDAILTVGHPINPCVSDAHVADALLLADGDDVHLLPRAAVEIEAQPCSDPSRRLFRVGWTPRPATRIAAGAAAAWAVALDRAALACAAQQLGLAQRMVELAVAYAGERQQFGRPIGSFQAVKHLLADVQVKIEFARPAVYRAAWLVAEGDTSRSAAVSHAKAAASQAALSAAKTALQVHGAIGYTWECDLQIWMKRAWALETAWGSSAWHRARVARGLFDGDGCAESFGFTPRR